MEVFEIHITGDESIVEKAKSLNLKTISIDLLIPPSKGSNVLRSEHMTSIVVKFENYNICKGYVDDIAKELTRMGVNIIRVKIECPYYPHYVEQSCYMESHFIDDSYVYATSRNQKKTTLLGTDREYDKKKYSRFADTWKGEDLELCLYDTFIEEDSDWFKQYEA